MKVPLKNEIYALETLCAKRYGIPKLVLMENAGAALHRFIEAQIGNSTRKKYLVFCGSGNNGGDGAVLARKLSLEAGGGGSVTVVLTGKSYDNLPAEAAVNMNILDKMKLPTLRYKTVKDLGRVRKELEKCDVVIDAIYGIGFREKKDAKMEKLIGLINASGKTVVSVDLPSGVLADGGVYHPVRADFTVAFAFPKLGTIDYPGREFTGKRFVVPIDLPPDIMNAPDVRMELITPELMKNTLIRRSPDSHKGTYGHLLLIGGNAGSAQSMAGAVILAGMSSLRSGAGLLTVAAPSKIIPAIQKDLPESMTLTLDDEQERNVKAIREYIARKKIRTVLIGNGFGTGERQKNILMSVFRNRLLKKIVIDADGLNNISENKELGKLLATAARSGKDIVVTPHVKEMSRLTGLSTDEIKKNKSAVAGSYSKKNRLVTALKDAVSFLSSAEGNVRINETGSSALAKGGSGDALAGLVAGLMASGYDGFSAASLGCYLLGRAGELYSGKFGPESALTRDVIGLLPDCFRELHNA